MGNRQPKSIFTDQDQAMANAIEVVFTGARHKLCMWHISNNAKQHLAGLFTNASFKALFDTCFYGCYDSIKFESDWTDMVEMFGLENHSCLKRLYDLREKWCPAFSVDFFSARMKSSQRSERTNSVFHQIMRKPMSLLQVIQYYEEKVEEMRRDERSDDFRCKNGAPAKVSKRGILNHASKVYTLVMFSKFEEELLDSFGLNCVEISCNGTTSIYHVTKDGRQRVHIVQFDLSNDEISCSCKLKEIPEPYILKRWTKSAKSGIEGDVGESLHQEGKSTRSLHLSELNHMGQNVFDKGSLSCKCTEIVKDKLREALKMVEEEIANLDSVDDLNCVEEDITTCVEEMPSPTDDRHVLDPLRIRTKGSTNARIKSYWEKKKRKTRRLSEKPRMPHPNHMVTGEFPLLLDIFLSC
ncbi:protein FAR1-RELATED SEQUENCE 5-like [Rhododendron vialii]|uniref:protein FAR1-RELATED SEQUENCE 5-like n=1 Tax=Rhododendron vialii TaxID=182163 RepID=UPI00265EC4BC|nr:protein FAR1-RELATED SEQUENCE 5-like [Rhododendron vialii]